MCVCIWGGGWGLGVGPIKKQEKIAFCGWGLCTNGLYPTTSSTTKTKTNTLELSKDTAHESFLDIKKNQN